MATASGEAAILLLKARINGDSFPPPGVEDTLRNRALRDEIGQDLDNLPPGVTPEIPFDHALIPED
jgi:hypothetical protein